MKKCSVNVGNKKIKKSVNTYSKKKQECIYYINIVNHYHYNPTYNTINVFSSSKSSSEEEFDKLLKEPTKQVPTCSSETSTPRRRKYFCTRQVSAKFYNSDTTINSPSKNSHLLYSSDILKDSNSHISTSRLSTPPSYRTDRNKLVKLPAKQKNTYKVQKRNLKKRQKPSYGVHAIKASHCDGLVSSTPTHPHKSDKNWIKVQFSPINPHTSTSNLRSLDHNSYQLLACKSFNKKKQEDEQSLGMSDLVANLHNLDIDIDTTHGSREKQVFTRESKDDSVTSSITNNKIKYPFLTEEVIKSEESPIDGKNVLVSGLEKPTMKQLSISSINISHECKIIYPDNTLNMGNELQIKHKNNTSVAITESSLQAECTSYIVNKSECKITSLVPPVITNNESLIKTVNNEPKSPTCLQSPNKKKQLLNSPDNNALCDESGHQQQKIFNSEYSQNDSVEGGNFSRRIAVSNSNYLDKKDLFLGNEKQENYQNNNIQHLLKKSQQLETNKNNNMQTLLQEINKQEDSQINNTMSNETTNEGKLQLKPGKGWRRSFHQQKHQRDKNCRRTSIEPILRKMMKGDECNLMSLEKASKSLEYNDSVHINLINNTSCEVSSYSSFFNTSEFSQKICTRKQKKSIFFADDYRNNQNHMHDIAEESCSLENENVSSHTIQSPTRRHFHEFECETEPSVSTHQPLVNSQTNTVITQTQDDCVVGQELTQQSFSLIPSKQHHGSQANKSSEQFVTVDLSNDQVSKTVMCFKSDDESNSSDSEVESDKNCSEHIYFNTPPFQRTDLNSTSLVETPPVLKSMNNGVLNTKTNRKKKIFSPPQEIKPRLDFSSSSVENSKHSTVVSIEESSMGKIDVLLRCDVEGPVPFLEAFPLEVLETGSKIGEGVFGEVFMLERSKGEKSVVKIIPVEGTQLVNNEPQKHFYEVLSELIISRELSSLRENTVSSSPGFCELKNKFCLQGRYPSVLLEQWDAFDKRKGSDNDSPEMFKDDQLYVALELGHGGEAVESFKFTSAQQAFSVFLQTTFSLAVAEASLDFEHRDLHVGNVLVKSTTDHYIDFIRDGNSFRIPMYGVKATIIDFTLSRITFKDDVLFFDLAKDPELFSAEGDYQFDIYRLMLEDVGNNWNQYKPITNIRWLHYLVDKFLVNIKYTKKRSKLHQQYKKKLEAIKEFILDFTSSSDLADYLQETYMETTKLIIMK